MKHKIDLGIVTYEPFPNGMAATNRMISYLDEVSKKNKKVKVYIAKPSERENNVLNSKASGYYKKIEFKYVHDKTVWKGANSRFKKLIIILNGILLLFYNFKKDNPKSIILISNNLLLILTMWIASKVFNFHYYQEKSEYPKPKQLNKHLVYKKIYYLRYMLFDGIIVMTNELRNFFLSIGQKNLFHLPMSVDFSKFYNLKKSSSNKYFAYCGGGNYERDGLLNIVKAFIEIAKNYKDYELIIVGPKNNNLYYKKILDLISNSECNQIKIIGKISSTEVPQIIVNAICLVMAPQKNFISGGFPTKLGEYLASGNPVICTSVSEIPYYLNELNSILIKTGDEKLLYKAFEYVLNNANECKKIGICGKKLAQEKFEVKNYVKSLISFLNL